MTQLIPIGEVYWLFAFAGALYCAGGAFDLVGCPALVGEIVVGMILGPDVAAMFSSDMVSALITAGQAGLMLMVLEGGISMDASVLRAKGIRAIVLAATGTALPVLLGWGTMAALGHDSLEALASGIALSSTAIGFTMRMMTDMKLLDTAEGQLITAAAMIDDVFSLVLLSMLSVVETGEEGGTVDAWIVFRPLCASLAVSLVGFAAFKLVDSQRDPLVARVQGWPEGRRRIAHERAHEAILAVLLGVGALAAWLSEGLYSTLLLGVFATGAAFCTTPLARDAYVHVTPIQAWASRVFFGATVGFQIPVKDLFEGSNVWQGLVLTVAAVLGKWLSGAWGTSIFDGEGRCAGKEYWHAFMRVGCAMIGRGELGFQLATESLNKEIISPEGYSATIWALLLATLLGPWAFRACHTHLPPPTSSQAVASPAGGAPPAAVPPGDVPAVVPAVKGTLSTDATAGGGGSRACGQIEVAACQ